MKAHSFSLLGRPSQFVLSHHGQLRTEDSERLEVGRDHKTRAEAVGTRGEAVGFQCLTQRSVAAVPRQRLTNGNKASLLEIVFSFQSIKFLVAFQIDR